MLSTMQDFPLTLASLFRHGATVYADSEVVTFEGDRSRRARYAEVAARAEKLAAALTRLGVRAGDRIGTLAWNTQEHLEAYLAVPAMGAVLHTLNLRLHPDQIAWIANHAGDKLVLVDATLQPLFEKFADRIEAQTVIVYGGPCQLKGALEYEKLLGAEKPGFVWPHLDERTAAGLCYTSGTTGHPKGVVYSHRSNWLHSLMVLSGSTFALSEHDRVLPIVPMFHANAWGLPYAGWLAGADFVMPGRFLQAEPLCRLIASERPTFSGAVPTIWNDILHYAEEHPVDLSSLRLVVCGGSAVPRALMEKFEERHGLRIIQGWGMTETSPLAAVAHPPRGTPPDQKWAWRAKSGRIVGGVDLRLVDDAGTVLPWDGKAVGEIQVRGPWVTASYYRDPSPEKFDQGWLRTGDVATVDARGFIQITDRAKDVIKSGGEWISSVELENAIMAHPAVAEAAVIGIPDERWQERPLACVVRRPGAQVSGDELRAFLGERVACFWLPERFAFMDAVPRTSVGKFDKKLLRAQFADGKLAVEACSGR
ncbi:MAG TPA: long-chain fatty acid--CoA ligase [Polyangia bacterium]|nr:long-chain fatty acid--CoA ligase [Polyangia bacterium]